MASDAAVYAFEPLPPSPADYFATVAQAKQCIQELCARYHKDICEDAHLRCSRHFANLNFQHHFPSFRTTFRDLLPREQENERSKNSYVRLVGLRGGRIGEGAWGDSVEHNVAMTTGYGSEMLPIRLNCHDNAPAEVELYVGYQWTCFSQWLQSTLMPRFNYYSAELTQQQMQAWSRNGKTFRLLDLPREIRDMIYLYAMGETASFDPVEIISEDLTPCLPPSKKAEWLTCPMVTLDLEYSQEEWGFTTIDDEHLDQERGHIPEEPYRVALVLKSMGFGGHASFSPHLVPLLANQQVREEVICTQWKLATKRVVDFNWRSSWETKACLDLIEKYQAHYSLGVLDCLQLYLDHFTYARKFKEDDPVNDLSYDDTGTMVKFLAFLPPIKTLNFHFARWDFKVQQGTRPFLKCYKVSIDWYFTILVGKIRHLIQRGRFNQIVISGHVKNSTRTKWEKIFADEKQGTVHDMAGKMELIRKASRKFDTRYGDTVNSCHCSTPCIFDNSDWWREHCPIAVQDGRYPNRNGKGHLEDPYIMEFNYDD